MFLFSRTTVLFLLICNLILFRTGLVRAQEYLMPLGYNADIGNAVRSSSAARPAALTLPFFEDFTDDHVYPSATRWSDIYVYVNNTMGVNMISRGVATFDALNEKGIPYDTLVPYSQVYADSLTSLPIDLSTYTPSDSLYLSFFYQPQGNGFAPKAADSFMLYLARSSGVWEQVWAVAGDTLQGFRQAMIPIRDTVYLHNNFRMRWINKATKGVSDSHWNLDYIRLDKDRNYQDTAVRDIAFTDQPASILNDFYAMPYRHFRTDPAGFLSANLQTAFRNNNNSNQSVPLGYTAKVVAPEKDLGTGNISITLTPYTAQPLTFPMYNASAFPTTEGSYIFENKFYCNSIYAGESKVNDTIVHRQVFDNYFAYDDGSAEKAYYLQLQTSAPGALVVEYALYAPDTLRGMSIRFGAQVPSGLQKEFVAVVYRDIAINGGTDRILYEEDFLFPRYEDTVNKFSTYTFNKPLYMDPGVFYIGIIQPAGGTSDSIYIGLDMNRKGANHRYFKIENNWEESQLPGALLLRPLVGAELPVHVADHQRALNDACRIIPNPSRDKVIIDLSTGSPEGRYTISDIQGRAHLQGAVHNSRTSVDIQSLPDGIYLVRVHTAEGTAVVKLLKQ